MNLEIFDTYEILSYNVAEQVISVIIKKPEALICLAAGDTPKRSYEILAQELKARKIDYQKVHFIGLDEWIGISPENPGSCQFFLRQTLLSPLEIKAENIHLFNAMAEDIHNECEKMDNIIEQLGGIDLIVVGIGMNGHIGFNEPGVSWNKNSHIANLDEVTQKVGQKYFSTQTHLTQGITIGLKQLLNSKTALLLANGLKKASIIKKALEEEMNENIPASIFQKHANGLVFLDRESSSGLSS